MTTKIGKLIAIEGPDTAGKSTVIKNLKAALPYTLINSNFLFTREPGNKLSEDNNESELIRKELLSNSSLTADKQAELFAKARYFHTINIIKNLKQGYNVITDRYLLSSLLYQGPMIGFEKIMKINNDVLTLLETENIDIHNIVLTISDETYDKRMSKKIKDAMEDVDYKIIKNRLKNHRQVKSVFHSFINDYKAFNVNNIHLIDANKNEESVLMNTLIKIYDIIK